MPALPPRLTLLAAPLLLSLVQPAPLWAQNADPLLSMAPGARVAALGHAAVALGDEPEAVATNPAALFTQQAWLQAARVAGGSLVDVSGNALAAGAPLAGGALGVAVAYDDYGDLVRTGEDPGVVLGEASLHDVSVGLSYARSVGGGLVAGVTGRYVRSDRGIGTATGAAVDAGVLLAIARSPLTIGASVVNLGGDLTYALDEAPPGTDPDAFRIALPRRGRLGVSLSRVSLPGSALDLGLSATYEAVVDIDGEEGLNHRAGAELSVGSALAVRGGVLSETNPFAEADAREWGTTAGLGVSSGGWVLAVARVMGLSSFGDATHLSAGYRF